MLQDGASTGSISGVMFSDAAKRVLDGCVNPLSFFSGGFANGVGKGISGNDPYWQGWLLICV